jgi:single-stranded DNA-specific DHH superfamily exonuclease
MAISDGKLKEIREELEKSERPIFFFDDDPDGLSSFLLFYRHVNRGKGIPVKTSPELKEDFAAKVNEYDADKVFVLDKPLISQDFIDACTPKIIMIDHHEPIKRTGDFAYYNPHLDDDKDSSPTSFWCYRAVNHELWIAMTGIIGDWFLPEDLRVEFTKQYPDLLPMDITKPEDALFNTQLGKLSRIFAFILKGKTTEVIKAIKILTRIKTPYEILNQETARGRFIYRKYEKVAAQYDELLKEILEKHSQDKIIIFTYPGKKMSFTGELSNELLYKFPDKLNLIAREKSGEMKCSLRASNYNLPLIIKHALKGLDGYGGGHEHACGACVKSYHFNAFVENLKKEIG